MRYDRELMATTLKAMSRVLEIRQKRQNQFIKNRYVCVELMWECSITLTNYTSFVLALMHLRLLMFMLTYHTPHPTSIQVNLGKEREENAREIAKNIDLVMAPSAPERKVEMQRVDQVIGKRMEIDQ